MAKKTTAKKADNKVPCVNTETLKHADDPECAYLLQEVSIFNNRVVWYLEQQQKQEVFALGASGAMWAYILQAGHSNYTLFLAAIPFVITSALALKSGMLTRAMQESMAYLSELEERFNLTGNMGWVHYYRKNTSHYKKKWRRGFWLALVLANIALAGVYSGYGTINTKANEHELTIKFLPVEIEQSIGKAKEKVEEKNDEQQSDN